MSQMCRFYATFTIPTHKLAFEVFEFVMSHTDDPYADKAYFKQLYENEIDAERKANLANILTVVNEIALNCGNVEKIVDSEFVDFDDNPCVLGDRKSTRRKAIELTGRFDTFDELENCYNAVKEKVSYHIK